MRRRCFKCISISPHLRTSAPEARRGRAAPEACKVQGQLTVGLAHPHLPGLHELFYGCFTAVLQCFTAWRKRDNSKNHCICCVLSTLPDRSDRFERARICSTAVLQPFYSVLQLGASASIAKTIVFVMYYRRCQIGATDTSMRGFVLQLFYSCFTVFYGTRASSL
jgi:hypothetical protein